MLWTLPLILISMFYTFSCQPLHRTKRQPYFDNVMSYLTQFGYLPESDRETGNLRTDDQLREAIKNLQSFAGIPETGQMDQDTLRMMIRPRCGVPDPQEGSQAEAGFYRESHNMQQTNYGRKYRRKKRYTVHGQKWNYTALTWSLRTKFGSPEEHGRARSDFHRALSVWSEHSKLTFREVNSDSADILIYFEKGYHGDGYPFDGKGQVLAHAFFPGTGRGGDVHFDIEEVWHLSGDDENNGEKTSLLSVAAHEFGHSLGLSHSSVPDALMYPWYQGLGDNFELHDDDKFGIQQLYGAKEKLWGKNTGEKPISRKPYRRPATTTTTTTRPTTSTSPVPRPTYPTRAPLPQAPDTCDTSYDAISVIRREVFIFKGKYLWRIGEKGLYPGYPALIERLWANLPVNFTHVDAVYERLDKKIVFFIGQQYFMFHGNFLEAGYPRTLSSLGLPESLKKIDAAMIWGHNSKTYLFSGTMYWKLDEGDDKVELDYPRDMSVWKGVGYDVDAVFQWKDGITYFFKGKGFWKFNDLRMQVFNEQPMNSGQFWLGCPAGPTTPTYNDLPTFRPKHSDPIPSSPDSAATLRPLHLFFPLLLILFLQSRS